MISLFSKVLLLHLKRKTRLPDGFRRIASIGRAHPDEAGAPFFISENHAKNLRMKLEAYNEFCAGLPATSHVVQWGGAHVWKVGGKVFAIGGWQMGKPAEPGELFVTFKVSELTYDILKELPGCRPAPYLASRGMKWIQRTGDGAVDDNGLRDYLRESHRIVASGLSQKRQRELGLD